MMVVVDLQSQYLEPRGRRGGVLDGPDFIQLEVRPETRHAKSRADDKRQQSG